MARTRVNPKTRMRGCDGAAGFWINMPQSKRADGGATAKRGVAVLIETEPSER